MHRTINQPGRMRRTLFKLNLQAHDADRKCNFLDQKEFRPILRYYSMGKDGASRSSPSSSFFTFHEFSFSLAFLMRGRVLLSAVSRAPQSHAVRTL